MPKSTLYLVNSLLVTLLLVTFVWVGNTAVTWYQSKSIHGYMIYNCPKSMNIKNLMWYDIKEKCKTVEHIDNEFFEVDEANVKERARNWARTTDALKTVKFFGEEYQPQNTYYRIW